ncbi:MAG: DUF971 domain-containing protein [Rhizobiaceae bacterium]
MHQDHTPRPKELRVSKDRRELTISFTDGAQYTIPAEALRVFSPSAEVQGHSPEQRKLEHGKREVAILQVIPTGNYAVRIAFDDMHDTGIFTWTYLAEIGADLEQRMAAYEGELAAKGLSRDKVKAQGRS